MIYGVSARTIVVAVLSLSATGTVLVSPQLLGDQLRSGLAGAVAADPAGLAVAALCFVAVTTCSGMAWHRAMLGCGKTGSSCDSIARFATGSLVNAVLPARAGSAVRVALFARALPGEGRLLAAGGAGVAAGAARAAWTAVVVAAAALLGGLPAWPAATAALFGAGAALGVIGTRRLTPRGRLGHLLAAFRALGASPAQALRLLGWSGAATGARLAAAAAVAIAVGLDSPLTAAVLIVAAVDVAAALPATPGNLGIAGAAIALVLGTAGADPADALAVGVAFSGLETLLSILTGSVAALGLSLAPRCRRPSAERVVPSQAPARA
jgi:uncharacterized membrane protein YbhN (UPF0104 family)